MINLRGEREMRPGQPFQFTWVTARQHRWIQARLFDSGEESKNYLVHYSRNLRALILICTPLNSSQMTTACWASRRDRSFQLMQTTSSQYGLVFRTQSEANSVLLCLTQNWRVFGWSRFLKCGAGSASGKQRGRNRLGLSANLSSGPTKSRYWLNAITIKSGLPQASTILTCN